MTSSQDQLALEIAGAKRHLLVCIDEWAGEARLRYITSVPGQAETYAKKEQQARDWAAASFVGDPPAFIAAEANALGLDPRSVANDIIDLADFWGSVKGPQIEAARRKWKVSASSAVDYDAISSIFISAKAELEVL